MYDNGEFRVRFNYEYEVDGSTRYGEVKKSCKVNFVYDLFYYHQLIFQ